jgi:hypothetical protein
VLFRSPQTVSYTITGNSTAAGTDLHISGADGANTRITQDAFGTGSYVAFTGRTGRGTAATPTQTQSGDALAQFTARGFSNGSLQFGNTSTGRVDVVAAENFTDTSRATNVQIYTTAVSSITPTAIATFSSAGGLSVTGNITGNFFIGNGSALTGITTAAGSQIINGTSNVTVGANGNITVGVAGTGNVAVFANTGEYVTGLVSATGNVIGNIINATSGLMINSNTISANYTLPSNYNAMSAGPITVAALGNVSVGDGQRWTIV